MNLQLTAVSIAVAPVDIGRLTSAKLNGLEPLRWPTQTVEKLPSCPRSEIVHCCHLQSLVRLKTD